MKKEYDFSKAKRGAVLPQIGKTRITIYLDDEIVENFKAQSDLTGKGYQTLINEVLRTHLGKLAQPVTAEMLRTILREELHTVPAKRVNTSLQRTPAIGRR
jgi:hypothetical protein